MNPSKKVTQIVFMLSLLIFASFYTVSSCIAEDDSDDDPGIGYPLDCPELPKAGADKLSVDLNITDGSYGLPVLIGIKEKKIIWKKKFPTKTEVNSAKSDFTCDGKTIKIWSQFPGSAGATVDLFSWDGKKIKKIKSWTENESADKIGDAIDTIASGKVNSATEVDLEIYYPQSAIYKEVLVRAISKGQKTSAKLYKARKTLEATRILGLMFDLTVEFAEMQPFAKWDNPNEDRKSKSRMELWLIAWKSLDLGVKDYITPLNNYGYYLQEGGSHKEAVQVFEQVEKADPQRAVNHLNLADSLWAIGQKKRAAESYKKYQDLIAKDKKNKIPTRVADRVGYRE